MPARYSRRHRRSSARPRPIVRGSILDTDDKRFAFVADLDAASGKLSRGQRAQLALTLGVAKRPALLILDEPVAGLDPLARREFL
jgi:ABC-2 type transport system ATP-binding protein